jgi:hypothetical protein
LKPNRIAVGKLQQGSGKVPVRFQQSSSKVPRKVLGSKVALNSCKQVCRSPLLSNVLDVSIYFLIQHNNSSVIKSAGCINIFHNYNTITAVHEWLYSKWHLNWPVLRNGIHIYNDFWMKQTTKLAYTWWTSVLPYSSNKITFKSNMFHTCLKRTTV